MTTYEQVKAEHFLSQAELERVEHEIYEVQLAYRQLNTPAYKEHTPTEQIDQEKVCLVHRVSELVEERSYWLHAKANSRQTLEREGQRHISSCRDQLKRMEEQLHQAQTPEQRQAALKQRDQANAQMDRIANELQGLEHDRMPTHQEVLTRILPLVAAR